MTTRLGGEQHLSENPVSSFTMMRKMGSFSRRETLVSGRKLLSFRGSVTPSFEMSGCLLVVMLLWRCGPSLQRTKIVEENLGWEQTKNWLRQFSQG